MLLCCLRVASGLDYGGETWAVEGLRRKGVKGLAETGQVAVRILTMVGPQAFVERALMKRHY